MNLQELLQQRKALFTRIHEMVELAETEKRDLTQEENNNYDTLWADMEKLDARIARMQKIEEEARVIEGLVTEPVKPGGTSPNPVIEATKRAWDKFLRIGLVGPELRALQADNDASGGYTVAPEQFVNKLIKAVDDQTFIRQWATISRILTAQSLGLPYLAADPADSAWTSELAIGTEDSTMSFGKRSLEPRPLAKSIKVSNKMLRLNPDVEALVIQRLAYKFGITFEKACLTGAGAVGPLGVFTASADGISTGRDVSTDNTATSMSFDGLKNAKYTLKGQYWPRAKWLFHRDGVKQIAKLKDSYNVYLWAESVRVGEPDFCLGIPAFMSEYAPNTFTASQYVGIIGDFSFYHIADALDFSIQRVVELYAGSNQTGFIGRLESDGMPVLEEAFVRVKLAAS